MNEGFAWALACADAPADPTTLLLVSNLTGGNNSHISGAQFFVDADGNPIADQTDDFDQGGDENAVIAFQTDDNAIQRAGVDSNGAFTGTGVLVYGTATGSTQEEWGLMLNSPNTDFGGADCVGSLNLLSL